MKEELCKKCGEREINVKKYSLCNPCYQRQYSRTSRKGSDREFDFIKSFFNHQDWIRHPVTFRLDNTVYVPDFYDSKRNVFIELAGTRQAFHENKNKYLMMKKLYPKIILEIRQVDGSIIDIDKIIHWNNDNKKNNP